MPSSPVTPIVFAIGSGPLGCDYGRMNRGPFRRAGRGPTNRAEAGESTAFLSRGAGTGAARTWASFSFTPANTVRSHRCRAYVGLFRPRRRGFRRGVPVPRVRGPLATLFRDARCGGRRNRNRAACPALRRGRGAESRFRRASARFRERSTGARGGTATMIRLIRANLAFRGRAGGISERMTGGVDGPRSPPPRKRELTE